MRNQYLTLSTVLVGACFVPPGAAANEDFEIPAGVEARWVSPENTTGAKGRGGMTNEGRKGSPWLVLNAGEKKVMADIQGPGVIRRIWATTYKRRPDLYRGLVIRMYWENQTVSSVEAPIQDFFGIPFARQVPFESSYFTNPEGRSYNCFIAMPFKQRALITLENQSPGDCMICYDIDYTIGDKLPEELAYFHARYRRENPTTPKKDFEILPRVQGKGRYLGANIGMRNIGDYREPIWWGEGEVKVYLDGDTEYPTLNGTGTEDFLGDGWGVGKFDHLYQGVLLSEEDNGVWGFYRYHVKDPIYFKTDIRVAIQQMFGASVEQYLKHIKPENYPELVAGHKKFDPRDYTEKNNRDWKNFEGYADVCATAYWYQTLPSPDFGPLDSYEKRMADLELKPQTAPGSQTMPAAAAPATTPPPAPKPAN